MPQLANASPQPPQILSGWKQIANHLGKAVRTVQRYERQLGLPVRRPAGKSRASVIASRAEVDGWVQASPTREMFRLRDAQKQFRSSAVSLKETIGEMSWLRDQMHQLRTEAERSMQKLRETVYELQGVGRNRWVEPPTLHRN
jgi:hypothetical protein